MPILMSTTPSPEKPKAEDQMCTACGQANLSEVHGKVVCRFCGTVVGTCCDGAVD